MAIQTEIKKKIFYDSIHNFIHRLILYTTDRKHQAEINSRYTSHSNKKVQSDIFEIIQERKELEGCGFHHSKEETQRHLSLH